MQDLIRFEYPPEIISAFAVAGPKESDGPIGDLIHARLASDKFGEGTFEKAERKMLTYAIDHAIAGTPYPPEEIGAIFSGDLLNQIVSATFAAREFPVPMVGLYSACSTMSESLAVASAFLSAGYLESAVAATGSHFASAERQYRFPLELGCTRPPVAQWTVTGAGALVLRSTKPEKKNIGHYKENTVAADEKNLRMVNEAGEKNLRGVAGSDKGKNCASASKEARGAEKKAARDAGKKTAGSDSEKATERRVFITQATFGRVIDFGVTDANNMGAAMAPAACDTLVRHFNAAETLPEDYDYIVTGDLGAYGSKLLEKLTAEAGFPVKSRHLDCGKIIYRMDEKDYQGGSGAGCSAVVLCSYLLRELHKKPMKIAFLATGALLSTVTTQQGESIPAVSHLVVISSRDEDMSCGERAD